MGAIAYGVASNGGYVLKDDSHYVKPEMVTKLPEKIPPPKGGPIEVVDEVLFIEFLFFRSHLLLIIIMEMQN